MIEKADADVMLELTYTDIKTGEPATDHIRAALRARDARRHHQQGPGGAVLQRAGGARRGQGRRSSSSRAR